MNNPNQTEHNFSDNQGSLPLEQEELFPISVGRNCNYQLQASIVSIQSILRYLNDCGRIEFVFMNGLSGEVDQLFASIGLHNDKLIFSLTTIPYPIEPLQWK